ncbi:3-mercaptopyruvate sulfurtransferase [Gadus chalcogrammus]|uniref:3-mercaptopyruvate sulfurtransferase n=1 Tax=Gadus chalcogrammus TaxID=1042646 RepID=UPI0024C297CC|nr:3-mercaptopyruvate sulfurtransferase [Gadus chalcogrammus]
MAAQTRALVTGKWLADALKNRLVGPKLRVLDSSWYLAKVRRNPRAEFQQSHIPGASFFDVDECSDKTSAFDHMVPSPAEFAEYVGHLGIANDTHVVVYDTSPLGSFSAPRVWWMFRLFGHPAVSVLDGGMKNWLAEGHPLTSVPSEPERAEFKASVDRSLVKTYEDVLENIRTKRVQVVDARSAGRFKGIEPEPRDDTRPGHFPGAVNMPFTSVLGPSGEVRGPQDLAQLFREAGVDLAAPLWVSCGSGVTACHVALAATLLGHPGACVYDGSWSEWFKRAPPELVLSEGP